MVSRREATYGWRVVGVILPPIIRGCLSNSCVLLLLLLLLIFVVVVIVAVVEFHGVSLSSGLNWRRNCEGGNTDGGGGSCRSCCPLSSSCSFSMLVLSSTPDMLSSPIS